MSINYIKENLKKFDHDNLISFLFDIIVRGGLDEVEDFNPEKEYFLDEKVYVKDVGGVHHIYKCIVEKAEVGFIQPHEWLDLLQSFRKPIVTNETVVTQLSIKEAILTAVENNQTKFDLNVPGLEEGDYTVVVFHPKHGRLSNSDFNLINRTILLNDEYKVENIDEKLIVDLYKNM